MEENKVEKDKQRFVRWQSRLIDQSAYLNNLLTTIGIAIIGFIFNLYSKDFSPQGCQKCFITFGLFVILISTLTGISGAITRLYDYRTTLKKIKAEIEKESPSDIKEYKELYKVYGKWTWCFFNTQSATLLSGVIILGMSLISYYSTKML